MKYPFFTNMWRLFLDPVAWNRFYVVEAAVVYACEFLGHIFSGVITRVGRIRYIVATKISAHINLIWSTFMKNER